MPRTASWRTSTRRGVPGERRRALDRMARRMARARPVVLRSWLAVLGREGTARGVAARRSPGVVGAVRTAADRVRRLRSRDRLARLDRLGHPGGRHRARHQPRHRPRRRGHAVEPTRPSTRASATRPRRFRRSTRPRGATRSTRPSRSSRRGPLDPSLGHARLGAVPRRRRGRRRRLDLGGALARCDADRPAARRWAAGNPGAGG